MDAARRQARLAGFLYLLVLLIAPFGQMYVPGSLIVSGDAAATAGRVLGAEWLFRLGIMSQLISTTLFLLVVLALHRLLRGVHATLAAVMLILVVVGIPVSLVNTLHNVAALIFFRGGASLSAIDQPQRDALGYAFLRLSGQGAHVTSLFWGLWLFPFGILVIRSRFIPRMFGFLLMVAGSAYLASTFLALLLPNFAGPVATYLMVLMLGEVPIIFYLLIRGVQAQPASAMNGRA